MSKQSESLTNHIICGQLELDELVRQGLIIEWQPKNNRHQLFLQIKHPNTRFYKGQWGPELILSPRDQEPTIGRPGYVYATFTRAQEITRWIIDSLFNQVNTGTN